MEELEELKERMSQERPVDWDAFPDLGLYMDQIISYMPRQLIRFDDREALTSAMVNNYIKDGLLARANGKKYGKEHLAYLTALCALKQVLSVKDAALLLDAAAEGQEPQALYAQFLEELDRALDVTAGSLDASDREEDLPDLAMALAQQAPTILMDEPTTWLDPKHQLEVMATARRLAAEGRAVGLVSHELSLALRTADQVALLAGGKLAAFGTPEQVYRSGALEEAFGVKIGRSMAENGWHYYYL